MARNAHPYFRDLARRVNDLPGYTASIVEGGAHGGRAFRVELNGRFVCRFSASPSVPGLALYRAEAELRRLGVPLPRPGITPKKEKEEAMPAPTAEEKKASEKLRPRIEAILERMDPAALAREAAEIVARDGGEPFGGSAATSAPEDIARASLRKFLEGGSLKQVNIDRWTKVVDALESAGQSNGGPPEEGIDLAGQLDDLRRELEAERELREVAVASLEEAERDRDEHAKQQQSTEQARLSLIDQLRQQEAAEQEAAARFQADLDRAEEKAERFAADLATAEQKLEQALAESGSGDEQLRAELRRAAAADRGLRGKVGQERRRRVEAEEALADALAAAEAERAGWSQRESALVQRAQEAEALHRESSRRLLDAEGALATVDRERRSALAELAGEREWARRAVVEAMLRELEVSNGAPRPWLLERLDALVRPTMPDSLRIDEAVMRDAMRADFGPEEGRDGD